MAPLAQRANQQDMGRAAPALLDVWIYFNLVSNTVLLPILVATFLFSRKAKRHPTLVNLCLTWIFSGIFSLLLFYAGQTKGPEPQKALCIAQTSLLAGITPMWSVAVLVLFYNMILVMNEDPKVATIGRLKMIAMLSAPYIAQVTFSIVALVGSLQHPENVSRRRHFFYCSLRLRSLSMGLTLFTSIIGVFISIAMIYLVVLLYRNWHGFRDAGRPSHVNLQLLLRVLIFGGYIIFGFVVNVISMVAPHNLSPDMYAATIGTVVFLVFGTQMDVLRTWCFWLKEPRPPTVYLPREPSWRESLDLTKSAVLPVEDFAHEQDKRLNKKELEMRMEMEKERSIAWGELAHAPAVV